VAFEVDGEPEGVDTCNCSICAMKGYVHWHVPRERFRLLTPEDAIETYQFNTKVAKHYFCKRCGVASFYIPRSHPDQIDVNLRCVEGVDLDSLDIGTFDGQNWEESVEEYREKTR
jgi:hypothetical protein